MSLKKLLVTAWILILLGGCSDPQPEEVNLGFLVTHAEGFDRQLIEVEGWVRGWQDPEHYWLEDEAFNRVGLEPEQLARDHLDQQVRIRGSFKTSSARGRSLQIEQLTPLP
ncbi:hypothetical protein [Marinospirillum perlucidum]|uniref:hypothetical protein n=1 Tax=Marinospirillum perlucidum TaxID=1982602 RepID=UPI000DF32361|nr:hypothetical protein [Marinospirillum perlucidum]